MQENFLSIFFKFHAIILMLSFKALKISIVFLIKLTLRTKMNVMQLCNLYVQTNFLKKKIKKLGNYFLNLLI